MDHPTIKRQQALKSAPAPRAGKSRKAVATPAQITIDINKQKLMCAQVLEGLANLQDCLKGLAAQYMQHTNYVLGDHAGAFDAVAVMTKFTENSVLSLASAAGSSAPQRAATPEKAGEASADGKKERKKRQHDPDAPKRPLTPFFLYMQTARPIIAGDLGPEAAKGAVSNEGTLRWSNMDKDSKLLWTAAYKENLRLYNARMHYYRLGFKEAKNMTDAEAATYAEENNLGDAGADAQLVGEASANHLEDDAEGEPEPEKEPTPPPAPVVKTPKGKGRKGKATKSAAVVEEPVEEEVVAPTPVASSSIVPPKSAEKEAPKSPDKKRKRASKKGAVEEVIATPAKEELAVETPTAKSSAKPRKKKAKSDA